MSVLHVSRQLRALAVMMLGHGLALSFLIGGFFFEELPFVFAMVMTLGFLLVGDDGYKRFQRLKGIQEIPVQNHGQVALMKRVQTYLSLFVGVVSVVLTVGFFIFYGIGMARLAQPSFALTTSAWAAPFAFVLFFTLIRNNIGKKFIRNAIRSRKV